MANDDSSYGLIMMMVNLVIVMMVTLYRAYY